MHPYNYCVYPFNYAHIGHKGQPALCCNNGEHRLPYNIKEHSLATIWNSDEINTVREQFTSGGCPTGCGHCFEPELDGVRSFRQKALRGTFGTNTPFNDTVIRGLDLRIGNTCNLRCIMCNSYSSIQLYKLVPEMSEHYGWQEGTTERILQDHNPKTMDWCNDEQAWQNIFDGIDENLQHVYMAGGEPFYVNNFEDILHRMMVKAPNARYVINTNGTRLLKDKDIRRFKDYNLVMRVSIDGVGAVDEYVRNGTNWQHKLKVMDQYYKYFAIECWDLTLNSLSVRQAPELITYLKTRFPEVQINVRPAYGNSPFHFYRLPESMRTGVLQWFEDNDELAWGSDSIIAQLKKPHVDYRWKLKQVVDFWDERGPVKLNDFDPELNKYIHDNIS
jgi:MoaA/NifB/PqqE/SkfB family radical SAM enzyme